MLKHYFQFFFCEGENSFLSRRLLNSTRWSVMPFDAGVCYKYLSEMENEYELFFINDIHEIDDNWYFNELLGDFIKQAMKSNCQVVLQSNHPISKLKINNIVKNIFESAIFIQETSILLD